MIISDPLAKFLTNEICLFYKEILRIVKNYDTTKLSMNLIGNERVKRLLRTAVKLISFSLFLLNHRVFCFGILNFIVIS